ncbi:phage tail tube protein [Nannocystis sp.]|uniref:phage tail tube protein n=1 Tax=Nannocystis sp. TaxID=1962667 RepID=UPI0025DE03DB|nr:phage tail tube protein [Nannocystis sp.]MBK7829626.1 hypothetical protein [Nannocystis sp.]
MATASGFDSQIGYATEATAGIYTAPTRAIEHVKESLKQTIERIESASIKAGRRHQGRWYPGTRKVEGTVEHELGPANLGILLRHGMGAVSSSGTGPYSHVFTPGALVGSGLSCQVGRPGLDGTVWPFSYLGCQIAKMKISAKTGEIVMVELSLVGQFEDTGQSLVAPTYAAAWVPFTFAGAQLSVAGSVFACDSFSFEIDNALDWPRYKMSATNPDRPLVAKESGWRSFTGSIEADFTDLTAYNRYVNGTEAAISAVFTAGAHSLTIAGNARFDGETPTVDGPGLLGLNLPFRMLSTTSDAAACTMTLVNGDATP